MIARILVVTVSGALAIHVPHSPHNIPLVKHHPIVELQYLKRLHAPNFFALDSKKNTRSRKVEFGQIPLHSSVVPSRKLATYFGTIGVGDNPTSNIKVLFDTGSCEFWVPGEECGQGTCQRLRKNFYKKSSSFHESVDQYGLPQPMSVQYLSGHLRGVDGLETIHLAEGMTVPNQTVSFARVLDIPILGEVGWDGILGLGASSELTLHQQKRVQGFQMKNCDDVELKP
eukprot:GHVN01097416.1.p1 GENE.GHVN01097416.1~~GHVN01097416.1.p1  ORF type:complete len:228 (-),score=14.94 GHVN01097416.1:80-763(-)